MAQKKKVVVRAKGHLTLPAAFRKHMGIETDTVLDAYLLDNDAIALISNNKSLKQLYDVLHKMFEEGVLHE